MIPKPSLFEIICDLTDCSGIQPDWNEKEMPWAKKGLHAIEHSKKCISWKEDFFSNILNRYVSNYWCFLEATVMRSQIAYQEDILSEIVDRSSTLEGHLLLKLNKTFIIKIALNHGK